MTDDPDDLGWNDLPKQERIALRRAAQSQIWWTQTGRKIKGTGPIFTAILAGLALWQVMGDSLREWLSK